jgi:hypothetical protein
VREGNFAEVRQYGPHEIEQTTKRYLTLRFDASVKKNPHVRSTTDRIVEKSAFPDSRLATKHECATAALPYAMKKRVDEAALAFPADELHGI